MNADIKIEQVESGFQLAFGQFLIGTFRTKSATEAVADIVKRQPMTLPEMSPADLCSLAGCSRTECVDQHKNKTYRFIWGGVKTAKWSALHNLAPREWWDGIDLIWVYILNPWQLFY
jgi:hypothetical protein